MVVVVVADKERELAELYAASLVRRGHKARLWSDEAALGCITEVVVVDTLFSADDDLVSRLRAVSPKLAVIATGIHSHPVRHPSLLGAPYLKKPFALAELEAAVVRAAAASTVFEP